jgi:hypothetical protein
MSPPVGPLSSQPLPPKAEPVGYEKLIRDHELNVLPPRQSSFVAPVGGKRIHEGNGRVLTVYPSSYPPGEGETHQIEFALKYEGVSLEILAALFHSVDAGAFERELCAFIRKTPTGQYARRLWFLYEFLTGRMLELPAATSGNYVPLLDPQEYYTAPPVRSGRHRVFDNLLGNVDFCPIVRRTPLLARFTNMGLAAEASRLIESYDEDALRRAVSYLYTQETRSSFSIEGEKPSPKRTERYIALLRQVPEWKNLDEEVLVRLQNQTVEPRFAESSYRKEQNYVGETVNYAKQRIHYIPPRPEDVPSLMPGLLASLERMAASSVDPVVQAAAVSFGFVFLHPFLDGNGRLHRMLIHYVLARSGFVPRGLIFPISAVMLQKRAEYDAALEAFSVPLMQQVDYEVDSEWRVAVDQPTHFFYRYIDFTPMAEALYGWVQDTIQTEFRNELEFIVRFRQVRQEMEQVVELPDRLAHLFIQFCLQNGGHLPAARRTSQFPRLTDEEIQALEKIIQERLLSLERAQPA